MKFSAITLLLAVSTVAAKKRMSNKRGLKVKPSFKNAILKTNPLTSPRKLEEEAEEEEIAFLSGYNVLYQNCFADSKTISFKLCPVDGDHRECDQTDCEDGGEYIVDSDEFINAFTEMQMDADEYRCEMARENCQDENDDAVEACYVNQGWDDYDSYVADCFDNDEEDEDGEEQFNLQEYLECKEFSEDYYVGPYCHNTVDIYLGLFTDEDCTVPAGVEPNEVGDDIPYTSSWGKSIIQNECASCQEHGEENDQNGGDDAEDEDEVIEQCEELYQDSSRCETDSMTSDYHTSDASSCEYIAALQEAEGISFRNRNNTGSSSNTGWIIFGVIAGVAAVGAVGFFVFKSKKSDGVSTEALM